MLKIFFGDMDNVIYNTSTFFKNQYKKEWITQERTIQMINDIDSSKVIGNGAIDSPVMGIIAPINLSGGVKTLILIDHISDRIFNASNCKDNCSGWLLKISKTKDVTINLRHIMNFGNASFEILVLNTNTMVHNMDELVRIAGRFV